MIDRVIHGLAASADLGAEEMLDAEEILDVCWLLAANPASQPEQVSRPRNDDAPPVPEIESQMGGEAAVEPDPMALYTERQPADDGDAAPALAIGFDAPRPLRDVVSLPMAAVRRLRKVVAPGPRLTVDIDATVEATAQARGRLMPVLTRPPQRALDLALVVDDSPSMRIWEEVFDDLERLLAQTSAFRSVSRWRLSPGDGAIRPHARYHDGDRGSAALIQRPEQLVDPSGRRLVLVATDARNRSWYDAAPWDSIETWCAAMPTVLVHVLPRQYWGDTAVGAPYMTSRALTPAAPNAQYQHRLAWWTADDPGGSPLPVVTLTEKSLDTWSASIVNGTAWAIGITATAPDAGSAPSAGNADVAVNDFLARATPGAERLARILASTGTVLSMPLISILRERLAPETGIAELAEILASGLLEDVPSASGSGRPLLRYRADAREILCRGTAAFEDWDALAAVGKYLEDRHQLSGPLRVLVPDTAGTAELDSADKPFHEFREYYDALAVRYGLLPAVPDTADLVPDPVGRSELDPIGDHLALLDALEAELARLDDSSEITIVEFGAAGITAWTIRRDENGTPRARQAVLGTPPVPDPVAFYTQRLAASLTGSRLVLVRSSPGDSLRAVFSLLRARSGAPAFDCPEPVEEVLRWAIRNSPLTRWYDLVVVTEEPTGQLRVSSRPLFQPGARAGDRTEPFQVECAAQDRGGTVFAVVSRGPGHEHLRSDRLPRVQVQSAVVPPGAYRVTALLNGPGKVTFDGLPAALSAEQRLLTELIRQVPDRLQAPERVHFVCLVEVSAEAGGDQARLRRRIDRLERLIAAAGTASQALAVSVISYGPHFVTRGMEEEPVIVRAWATTPGHAELVLRGLLDQQPREPDREYSRAAQIECALDKLAGLLYERTGRPVVVTAGGRPPHPPQLDIYSEIIPCPDRVDWRSVLGRPAFRGIRFGAVCDPDAIGDIWSELGRDAIGYVDAPMDARAFVRKLGLREPAPAPPFPLIVPAIAAAATVSIGSEAARGQSGPAGSRAARIAVLGPVGSGTTTFLAALNKALSPRAAGSGPGDSDAPAVNPLTEMTELVAARGEFPPPTHGTDWFEWTLLQQGTRLPDPSPEPVTGIPLRVMLPAGNLLHPSMVGGPERRTLIRDLAGVQGLIYMFDPIRQIDVGDAFQTANNLLSQLGQRVAGAAGSGPARKLEHYVAICLTKFDDRKALDKAGELGLVTTDRSDPYGFPRVAEEHTGEFLVGLSSAPGGADVRELLSTLERYFHRDRIRYFITSAIGFYVSPDGRYNPSDPTNAISPVAGARAAIRGPIHPINVVEPLLWLTAQIAAPGRPPSRRRRG